MNRRILGLVAALVLALVGTVALVAFVSNAEARALEGEQLVEVYVIADDIPAGTAGEDIESFVSVEEVPVKVRPAGAVPELSRLIGLVASVDLLAGEELVIGRFVERSEFVDRAAGVQVPEDMVEVTLELEPERAVGGLLEPGQTVAVLSSFEPFDLTSTVIGVDGEPVALPQAVADAVDAATPNSTETIIRKAIVTAVQEKRSGGLPESDDADRLRTAPEDTVLVTIAVRPSDAERVVFSKEFGLVWLVIDRETVPDTEDSIKTRGNVYENEVGF